MKKVWFLLAVSILVMVIIVTGCAGQSATPSSTVAPPTTTSVPAPVNTQTPLSPVQTTPTTAPASTQAQAKAQTITAVYSFPILEANPKNFVAKVNSMGAGIVQIDLKGGTEVIPAANQADALRTGAIDLLVSYPPEYAEALMPMVTCINLFDGTFEQEREIGATALWDQCFKKFLNSHYVGKIDGYMQYQLFMKKPINKLADIKGKILRGSQSIQPMIKALGASGTIIPVPDLYSALERGVVDGIIISQRGPKQAKLMEVLKCMVEPCFFQSAAAVLINQDTWNKLSPQAQDVITNALIKDIQPQVAAGAMAETQANLDAYNAAGLALCKFSDEDSRKFLTTAYGATWDYVIGKSPDFGPQFKALADKVKSY
jgi:TRAP-type transport system periplasmic protein